MNWKLIGHQWAAHLLQRHLLNESLRHAYLFCGPEGIGRRTMALRLTQSLFCTSTERTDVPCLHCKSCQQVERMEHPDFYPINVSSDSQVIKIDQIRELHHSLSLSPYQAPYQVALLQDFEKATHSAQNALLKTLEEPPPQVLIILTAENPEMLLETIVSRCEVVNLRTVPLGIIQRELIDEYNLESDNALKLAHLSAGRPGAAVRLHQQPELRAKHQQWLDELQALLPASIVERFSQAKNLKSDAEQFIDIIDIWLSYWRDVLLAQTGANSPLINIDRRDEISEISKKVSLNEIKEMINNLEEAREQLTNYANTQLTIENLFLQLPTL
ncbi:MAG: DNA polymerase III subunit delta' [Anaerolineales bacterium]|nr:DNA polymerase III subunit delta' [Anaerolineales bacterium]